LSLVGRTLVMFGVVWTSNPTSIAMRGALALVHATSGDFVGL
jgi:hypothetical protein